MNEEDKRLLVTLSFVAAACFIIGFFVGGFRANADSNAVIKDVARIAEYNDNQTKQCLKDAHDNLCAPMPENSSLSRFISYKCNDTENATWVRVQAGVYRIGS